MSIEPDRLYQEFGYLIAEMPDMASHQWKTAEGQRWLGRASALLEDGGHVADAATFNALTERLSSNALMPGHPEAIQRMSAILYRALGRAELQASAPARGAFIPVGEAFSAFAAISKVLSSARSKVMFVDPYADANILTDFAVLAPEGVEVLILADESGFKAPLVPAAKYWLQQYGARRVLEVRLAQSRSLHDRLIIVDEVESWSLGQSFNALAARAHTSLLRADPETAGLKIKAHYQIWQGASSI